MSVFLPSNDGEVPCLKQGYHSSVPECAHQDCSDWRNPAFTDTFIATLDSFIKRADCSCTLQSCFSQHAGIRQKGEDKRVAAWVYIQDYKKIHDRITLRYLDQWADIRIHLHELDANKHDILSSRQEKTFNQSQCFVNPGYWTYKLNEVSITVVLKLWRRFLRKVNKLDCKCIRKI